jgi:hypothetical protein
VLLDVSDPPSQVASGLTSASYSPSSLAPSTTYFWQIVAHNSSGDVQGPTWTFTTAVPPPPPGMPSSPNPSDGANGVAISPTLAWSSTGATSYDVRFGTSSPLPTVSAGQPAASYAPPTLASNTTYFWQIVSINISGSTTGPVWSFTTAAAPPPPINEIVIYASDVPAPALIGGWAVAGDAASPGQTKLVTPDIGAANTATPLAAPLQYFDISFNADAGRTYTIWLRLKALNNSKFNDAVWVQFNNATFNGSAIYPIGSTSGLLVNLATDVGAASLNGWGWANGAYWLSQPATVVFATGGTQTMRIQIREDGVQLDQIVLSHANYLNLAPGPPTNDSVIVPKP